jgi:hypothetical protein
MNKKMFISVLVVGILASSGFGFYKWKTTATHASLTSVGESEKIVPTEEMELMLWTDQAGFSFNYPKDVKYDIHEEDLENYAHIEFTHPDHPGTIIVWAKDTTASDITTWIKKDKVFSQGTMFDTEFAGLSGKKVLLTTPKKKTITAVIDEAIVFYVEGEFDQSEYWSKTYEHITSSFAFISGATGSQEGASGTSSDGSEELMVDEEEVLE